MNLTYYILHILHISCTKNFFLPYARVFQILVRGGGKIEIKTKLVLEQWVQLKMTFLLGYNLKIVIYWGNWLLVVGSGGRGVMTKFLAGGGTPTPITASRENPVCGHSKLYDLWVISWSQTPDHVTIYLPPKLNCIHKTSTGIWRQILAVIIN